jgi:hypothetical protein
MNHGLLNKAYYKHCVNNFDQEIIKNSEYITELSDYFKAVRRRDKYYIAMKFHAIELLRKLKYTTTEVGNLLNLDHSSVVYLKNKYQKLPGHDKFIIDNFTKLIKEKKYPITDLWGDAEFKLVEQEKLIKND